jgi:hypothetical protein
MRPGSPLVDLQERLTYLAEYPLGWSLGWGSWMLCTLALIAFLACLVRSVQEKSDSLRLALLAATAGGAVDLLCDTIQITALPLLASQAVPPITVFLLVERIAGAGGLVVANGAYTLAILLATVALRQRAGLVPGTVVVGYIVVAGGSVLVVAGFMDSSVLAAAATGPTIGLYCVWTVLVAWSVERPGKI